MNFPIVRQKFFLVLLVAFTLAFFIILLPFYGAVFWAVVLAVIFTPFHRRLLAKMNRRANLAAVTTLLICTLLVLLPLVLVLLELVSEASMLYGNLRSGQIDLPGLINRAFASLPDSVVKILDRFGVGNLSALQSKLAQGAVQGSEWITRQVISIGQNTFNFMVSFAIMMYILFFLLRDGDRLVVSIKQATPLNHHHKRALFNNLTTAIRATVKGNIIVASVQGALGGVAFWFLNVQGALLWAVLMAFLSLLPAVGPALVWLPVAVYFLLTGATTAGVGLIIYGVIVIGLVDNILRPILVGKETRLPDYIVLISTLGGMTLLGLNGFVIGPVVAAMCITLWEMFASGNPKHEVDRTLRIE